MGVLHSFFEKSKRKSNETVLNNKNIQYINSALPLVPSSVKKKECLADERSSFEKNILCMRQNENYHNQTNESIYSFRPSKRVEIEIVMLFEWHYFSHNYDIFHFTSRVNADSILDDRFIRPTQARVHCKFQIFFLKNYFFLKLILLGFGFGVFLTTLGPENSDHTLIENNYQGNTKYSAKVECAFAFDSNELKPIQIRDRRDWSRDIWRIDYRIELNNFEFKLVYR